MNKVKELWTNHKRELVIAGCIIGGVIVATIITQKMSKKAIDLTGECLIHWKPSDEPKFINLEQVKEILDLNATNSSMYAIFREGADPNAYQCILLTPNV